MKYPYTSENRLEIPHKYMYSSFEGLFLLSAYKSDRIDFLKRISVAEAHTTQDAIDEARVLSQIVDGLDDAIKTLAIEKIAGFDIDKLRIKSIHPHATIFLPSLNNYDPMVPVMVLPLLKSLISSQLNRIDHIAVKQWLNLLVQRFEVTKKIYSAYQSGFRKGEGECDIVLLYWLFALALILHYLSTKEIKFLSTLLKVMDLLSSLPEEQFFALSKDTMSVAVIAEMVSVTMLSNAKGIHLDS